MDVRLPWLDLFGKSVEVTRFGEHLWRAFQGIGYTVR